MVREIPDNELAETHVPDPHSDWTTIWKFALTFNGYENHGGLDECAEIANSQQNETLTDLRTCLFFEQRRWRHIGEFPDENSAIYIRNLVEQIKQKLMDTKNDT